MFDLHCLRLMYDRLEMDDNVVGTCCMQRVMSAEQQGELAGEALRKPQNAVLRLLQQFDMEV